MPWKLTRNSEWEKTRELYHCLTPMLHFEVSNKFVWYAIGGNQQYLRQ